MPSFLTPGLWFEAQWEGVNAVRNKGLVVADALVPTPGLWFEAQWEGVNAVRNKGLVVADALVPDTRVVVLRHSGRGANAVRNEGQQGRGVRQACLKQRRRPRPAPCPWQLAAVTYGVTCD